MKQLVAANNGINPSLLGVPLRWTDTPPTVGKMPERFNANNSEVWLKCVQACDTRLTAHEQWSQAIQMYIRMCGRKSLDPFTTELDRADNEAIRAYLTMLRINEVKWYDKTRILELLYINKVWYDVELREQGFVIHVYARCLPQCSLAELQLFARRVCKFHIVPGNFGKTWQGYPRPDLLFDIKLVNSQHVRLHYAITVTRALYVDKVEKGVSVSAREIKEWIIKNLWMPVARGHRTRYTLRKTAF